MKRILLAALCVLNLGWFGVKASSGAGDAPVLEVLNPERELKPYLVWGTCSGVMEMLPPTLQATPGYDHHAIGKGLASMMGDADTKNYYRTYAQAIDYANELVNKAEISAGNICHLHALISGASVERSPLRAKPEFVNRFGFPMFDLGCACFVQACEGVSPEMLPAERVGMFKRFVAAFSKDGAFQIEWVEKYISVLKSAGDVVTDLDFIARLKECDAALADHLFDTTCTDAEALPAALEELCGILNSTADLTASVDCFEHAFAKAEEVFMSVIKNHFFEDANGRMARFLANLVLVRAGLLPVTPDKTSYNKVVRIGLSVPGFVAAGLKEMSFKMAEYWREVPAMPADELKTFFVTGGMDHRIIRYESERTGK